MAWEELGGAERAHAITSEDVMLSPVSETFHGRDVFAPAAAHLAAGRALEELGAQVELAELAVVDVPRPMVAPGVVGARVVGVDGFGNVQLNATPRDLESRGALPGPCRSAHGACLVSARSPTSSRARPRRSWTRRGSSPWR